MTTTAPFALRGRNPDVLTCIANLSNDEVFTPPDFANRMLDTLAEAWAASHGGANIWEDHRVTFLDPCTKSGVFLREITSRLTEGLARSMPDLEARVDHILTKQVFGIGITRITSLLARRSLYCSKFANGKHSVASSFADDAGNVWFERIEHTWDGGSCRYCRVPRSALERDETRENYAYPFLHAEDISVRLVEMFGKRMQFDVIIGNPPYQMNDGGGEGSSAIPLYHLFVQQAKALNPQHLIMVVPARWYSGGKGLDEFRTQMLGDGKLAEVYDYPETENVFPGINIRGGVCYFLWKSQHNGLCKVTNYKQNIITSISYRPSLERGLTTFVRYNEAIAILNKVRSAGEDTFDNRVWSRNPFGIPSDFTEFVTERTETRSIKLYRSRRGQTHDRQVYVGLDQVQNNQEYIYATKVLVSKASPGGDDYPHAIFSMPFVGEEGSVCTETYLVVDIMPSSEQAHNLVRYMKTRFFRFLVSLIKNTQNISKGCFAFVPVLPMDREWTDAELYERYGIGAEDIAFINSMIRPMADADD